MLGLTQHQMADLIGVTAQQAHKYERKISRVSSGRLFQIAQALAVDVGYFFERTGTDDAFGPTQQQQRLLLELARDFNAIPIHTHKQAILSLTRALADHDAEDQTALCRR
jgi:transcriptional regulator with XRE-family HTH domain